MTGVVGHVNGDYTHTSTLSSPMDCGGSLSGSITPSMSTSERNKTGEAHSLSNVSKKRRSSKNTKIKKIHLLSNKFTRFDVIPTACYETCPC